MNALMGEPKDNSEEQQSMYCVSGEQMHKKDNIGMKVTQNQS